MREEEGTRERINNTPPDSRLLPYGKLEATPTAVGLDQWRWETEDAKKITLHPRAAAVGWYNGESPSDPNRGWYVAATHEGHAVVVVGPADDQMKTTEEALKSLFPPRRDNSEETREIWQDNIDDAMCDGIDDRVERATIAYAALLKDESSETPERANASEELQRACDMRREWIDG